MSRITSPPTKIDGEDITPASITVTGGTKVDGVGVLFDTIHADNWEPSSLPVGQFLLYARYNNVTAGLELCVAGTVAGVVKVGILDEMH